MSICFFNQEASDLLQHIAICFEISAIYLIARDYKIRESDIQKKGRGTFIAHMPVPHNKRRNELTFAYIIAGVAILMEAYQLISQYMGC